MVTNLISFVKVISSLCASACALAFVLDGAPDFILPVIYPLLSGLYPDPGSHFEMTIVSVFPMLSRVQGNTAQVRAGTVYSANPAGVSQ